MNTDDVQEIEIEASKTDCKINPKKYFVKKMKKEVGEENVSVHFFATLSSEFVKNSEVSITDRYKQQAGYIWCSKGYIENVHVNGEGHTVDARDCGIGSVLSTLCMNDGELNLMPTSRIDIEFIKKPKVANTVKTGCKNFVGLQMVAQPPKGAHAYFSAAINLGYNRILIKIDANTFKWMDTQKVRSCYADTGMIGKEGDAKIRGHGKTWYFCEELPGKFPKFPSTDKCFIDADELTRKSV